jgi:hypothetical protein
MKAVLILVASLGLTLPHAGSAQAAAATAGRCQPAQAGRFDFWIGKWSGREISPTDGKPQPGGSSSTVEVVPVLAGCGVLERREIRLPKETLRTLSLFAYDGELKRWRLHFFDDAGINQEWEGDFVDGHWQFSRERVADGKKMLVRITWVEAGKDRVLWETSRSEDSGKTWVVRSRTEFIH